MDVPRVSAKELTYDEFAASFQIPNRPVVLTGVTAKWGCVDEWIWWPTEVEQDEARPHLMALVDAYGEVLVPVVAPLSAPGPERETKRLDEYVSEWNRARDEGVRFERYLKDWHFTSAIGSETARRMYQTPAVFRDDWLNPFCDADPEQPEDYRFVYLGPEGSLTPCHHDVLSSYSWSVNVVGQKSWVLFPPEASKLLYDNAGRELVEDPRPGCYDETRFPSVASAPRAEILQETGEAVFVPAGWHHAVYNLKDTLSINHNWFNGYGLPFVTDFLIRELSEVRRVIEWFEERDDPRAWQRQCELVLRANSAFSLTAFARLLETRGGAVSATRFEGDRAWDARDAATRASDVAGGAHHAKTGLVSVASALLVLAQPPALEHIFLVDSADGSLEPERCRLMGARSRALATIEALDGIVS